MTKSIKEFIDGDNDVVLLAIPSAVFKGRITFNDGISKRVELSDCVCYAGGKEIEVERMTFKVEEIIAWGIPNNGIFSK